jgi:hypothetical protein
MTDFLATLSPSLSLLRAHLYVGVAHITVRSPRGLMQTAPKGFALLETHKDASLLDLDQVSLGWSLADAIAVRNSIDTGGRGSCRYTIAQ